MTEAVASIHPDSGAPQAPAGDPINALLMAAARAPQQIDAARFNRLSDAERAELARRADEHRFLSYLNFALSRVAGVAGPLPGAQARRAWTLRQLSISRECSLIDRILSENRIPHLFLKGIPLAIGRYPDPALRPVRDIDILVPPEDLPRAFELLIAQGGPIERYAHKTGDYDPAQKHCTPIWSPSRLIPVELHDKLIDPDRLPSGPAAAALTTAIWADSGHVRVGTRDLPCPGPAQMFLHLVIHALYDHELNNGPLFVTDLIHLLQGPEIDRAEVTRLSAALGIETGVALALSLLPPETPQRAALAAAVGSCAALPQETATMLLLQNMRLSTETKLAATLAQAAPRARAAALVGKLLARRETMLDRWMMAGKAGAPPSSRLRLWLWYLADRTAAMRRLRAAQPEGAVLPHLLALRRLRDAGTDRP